MVRVCDDSQPNHGRRQFTRLFRGPIYIGLFGRIGKGRGCPRWAARKVGYFFASRSRAAALSEVMAPFSVGSGTGAKSGE